MDSGELPAADGICKAETRVKKVKDKKLLKGKK